MDWPRTFQTKKALAFLLVAVFVFNFVETQMEEWNHRTVDSARGFKEGAQNPEKFSLGYRVNQAFFEMEGEFRFDSAESLPRWVIAGYSFSYFFLFFVLLLGTAIAFWRQRSLRPFRVFAFALSTNYFFALPFFLLMPVPERWAFPDAGAVLLSDLLSTRLIELIRPISGLDNCFPSAHVSFSVITMAVAYWYQTWWRHISLCLGLTVILSTFVLGIHWIPDMVMGTAMGLSCFALAIRLDEKMEAPKVEEIIAEPRRVQPQSPLKGSGRKLVFISYRRDRGSNLARIVQAELEKRGFPCFLDVDDLGAEHFDERLLEEIKNAPNFVLVLSPESLDRCHNEKDWLRKEIGHAIRLRKNIVPLMVDGFQFPEPHELPDELQTLARFNGVVYSHEYHGATFEKLLSFLKT